MDVSVIMVDVVKGAVSGAGWASTGFVKAHAADEKWDTTKFLSSTILGGVIGGIAGATGMSYTDSADWLKDGVYNTGAVAVVEMLSKGIYRHIYGTESEEDATPELPKKKDKGKKGKKKKKDVPVKEDVENGDVLDEDAPEDKVKDTEASTDDVTDKIADNKSEDDIKDEPDKDKEEE